MRRVLLNLILISSTLLFCSCKEIIYEDRGECPCALTLDLSRVSPSMGELYLWAFNGAGELILRDTILPYYFGKEYSIDIKREVVNYHLWSNLGGATELSNYDNVNAQLVKVDNISADSLYSYSKEIDVTGEEARDVVELCKEFAKVEVAIKEGNSNMWVEFVGNSCGYGINSNILSGRSKVTSYTLDNYNNDFYYFFRITRQKDLSDIKLNLYENSGSGSSYANEDALLNVFSIGKWLKESGYDMFAQDLSDIFIEINCSNNYITIETEDWSYTAPVYVEL